uniref:Uncharacterized protein n=1 Tax=Rhizophora mucronata TaxID=61149 RepID=A0A2P2P7Y7_RHIMU
MQISYEVTSQARSISRNRVKIAISKNREATARTLIGKRLLGSGILIIRVVTNK